MKRTINILKLGIALSLLIGVSSCKKYGFHVADGYGVDSLTENITVDTSDSKPDFSMLSQARVFPGLVGANEPRLKDSIVTLDLNYLNEANNRLRISVTPQPVFSTGVYAPPGEPVEIDVPANLNGLVCQIGMWTDNLSNTFPRQRAPIVYNVKQLFPGRNYVRSLFGGNIYIKTDFPIANPVQLKFSGACKSPDFMLGQTDPAEWKQSIIKSQVPWFEFGSKHIVFTLPTDKMVRFFQTHPNVDPIVELKAWDDIISKDYEQWEGLSDTAAAIIDRPIDLPWRVVLDIQPVVGYGHNGYPVVAQNDNEWFSGAMTASDTVSIWGTLHELGHNNQQGSYWSWSTLGETSNNLFSFKRAHRIGIQNTGNLHPAMPGAVAAGLAFTAKGGSKNFDTDPDVNSPFTRIVPFLQIFNKVQRWDGLEDGWGFFPYLYRRARHAKYASIDDLQKHDFLYEALSEYTGTDCYKFFQAWGIQLSAQALNQISNEYPVKLAHDIWNYNPITRMGGNNVVNYTISRADWTVAFDSQETEGENGAATNILDGNINTFWHSQWYAASPPYPHYLMIDMRATQNNLHGIYFTLRQDNASTRPKHVEIWLGPDATHLTKYMEADLLNQAPQQAVNFASPQSFRVFKLVFTTPQSAGSLFASMAEINVF